MSNLWAAYYSLAKSEVGDWIRGLYPEPLTKRFNRQGRRSSGVNSQLVIGDWFIQFIVSPVGLNIQDTQCTYSLQMPVITLTYALYTVGRCYGVIIWPFPPEWLPNVIQSSEEYRAKAVLIARPVRSVLRGIQRSQQIRSLRSPLPTLLKYLKAVKLPQNPSTSGCLGHVLHTPALLYNVLRGR